jgi:hypothetical protein
VLPRFCIQCNLITCAAHFGSQSPQFVGERYRDIHHRSARGALTISGPSGGEGDRNNRHIQRDESPQCARRSSAVARRSTSALAGDAQGLFHHRALFA